MTLVPGRDGVAAENVPKIAAALIRLAGVSQADLLRAADWQRRYETGFAEAIVALGIASQATVDAAANDDDEPPAVARADLSLKTLHVPFHPHSERIRALRTEVQLRRQARPGSALAVLGTTRGEGRSRLAAELAIAYAQLGEPTLLIDADLRKPDQHRLFGIGNVRGLSVLAECRQPRFVPVTEVPALALLTAGATLQHPQELLASQRFADALRDWSRRYRHIIIDTAAGNGLSDGLAVAAQAGAAVLCARRDHTHLVEYRALLQRLRAASVSVLAGVLTPA